MLIGVMPVWAAEPAGAAAEPGASSTTAAPASNVSAIEQLKQMLLDQQRQLNDLRRQLSQQQLKGAVADQPAAVRAATPVTAPAAEAPVSVFPSTGQVASTTAMVPRAAALPAALPVALPQKSATDATTNPSDPCDAPPDANAVPPFLRLGSVCIVPIGFMDLTTVWRDKNAGSSMGSNFGSIPYNNTVNGNLSNFLFSPQNSRIGFRIDGDWKGTHFIGYNEFDFNGTSASNGLLVSNGAFVPRLRLFWVDARKGKVEFLAGQSWSLMTPNRSGLSALPGNLFYTQVVDINYVAGLTWTRQPGMRVLIHPSDKVTFGVSFENPDQYAGGSAGGSGITLPAAYAIGNSQLDISQNVSAGQNIYSQPTVAPDIIAKVAFDPSSRLHFEVGGVERNFKIVNPAILNQHFSATGAGVMAGLNAEIFKNFRLITTNYWSDGGGRYLFGQAPDLIVRADGSLSLVHSGGTVDGFETRVRPNTLLYAYYSGVYIGRDTALDANGTTKIGYGYAGSANSQNRAIQEMTFGFNQTLWANPRYGAINAMGQYEYLMRAPWYVASGAPKGTHDNTIYFNLRYTLPGATPNF
jgi:hypothetical protein